MSKNELYTYLYIANFPKDADLFKKMFEEYVEKSFDTESMLVIVIDKPEEKMKYIEPIYQGNCAWPYSHISLFTKGDQIIFDWQTLIKQADCYIVGSNEYETSYVTFAFDNGLDILSSHARTVFQDMPIVEEKAKVKEQLKLAADEIVRAYPPHEWDYILFNTGFGESCIFFYWMEEYKKINPRKILVLCYEEPRVSLLEECPYIDETMTIPPILMGYINVYLTKQYNNIKNFLLIQLLSLSDKPYINDFGNVMIDNGEGMLVGMIRNWLGIKSGTKLVKYDVDISKEKVDRAKNLFKELKLREGRTVFIVADGYTLDSLSEGRIKFWRKLVAKLKYMGYDVVTKGDHEIIPNCKFVFLPPWESAIFIGLCGNVIAVPTGIIFSVTAFNTWNHVNIQTLLPSEREHVWRDNWLNWYNYMMPIIMREGGHFINSTVRWFYGDLSSIKSDNISFRYITNHNWDDKLISELIENIKEDEKNQK